ncbi:hypothetical protein CBU_1408 [Coxiella burnetii RSA 493]|uniref:Uncharacterized protein n=1 Tax=Coxiella burnetii (strain RSA 493 / Nine Mile phase I) TaxID=227377 RepID=Q83BU3_COXBU|nr:hypothetical protein CBU_1408 [Coxiella burnetii RSA 493]BBL36585.1 hypothetical protein CBU406_C05780 [Coxiella burnetii]BBL39083.1 hypothetical protein CBUVS42_C13520 [Coxiella burnetii]
MYFRRRPSHEGDGVLGNLVSAKQGRALLIIGKIT